jgi:hypothetical protein
LAVVASGVIGGSVSIGSDTRRRLSFSVRASSYWVVPFAAKFCPSWCCSLSIRIRTRWSLLVPENNESSKFLIISYWHGSNRFLFGSSRLPSTGCFSVSALL